MEKIYHIYAKDRCIVHSVKEEDFPGTWNTLRSMVGLMKTDYELEDLNYVELPVSTGGGKDSSFDPPGSPSY